MTTNLSDIYAKCPELEEIAMRLEESEKDAKRKNSERSRSRGNNDSSDFQLSTENKKRRTMSVNAEHAKISQFYKDNRWVDTTFTSKPGRQEFENTLVRVIDTRKPDAIKIKIYPSARELTMKAEKTIWLNTSAFNEDAEKNVQTNEPLGAIQEEISKIKNQLTETNKTAPIQDMSAQIQLLQLQQAAALKDIQHKYEIERLSDRYEAEIKELKNELEEKDAEIEDLEQELADVDESLNGIEEKIEAAKNPSYLDLAGKAISRGIENLAKDNTKLVSDFLGMTEDELAGYFKDKENKKIEKPATDNEASYSTASTTQTDSFSHLSDEKRRYAETFLKFTEALEISDLRVIITMLEMSTNEDASLNRDVADAMIKAGLQAKSEQNENEK